MTRQFTGNPGPLYGQPRDKRLDVYVEADLYDWIHRQATSQQRSMSAWVRFIIVQLRAGLQPGDEAVTLGGGTHGQPDA